MQECFWFDEVVLPPLSLYLAGDSFGAMALLTVYWWFSSWFYFAYFSFFTLVCLGFCPASVVAHSGRMAMQPLVLKSSCIYRFLFHVVGAMKRKCQRELQEEYNCAENKIIWGVCHCVLWCVVFYCVYYTHSYFNSLSLKKESETYLFYSLLSPVQKEPMKGPLHVVILKRLLWFAVNLKFQIWFIDSIIQIYLLTVSRKHDKILHWEQILWLVRNLQTRFPFVFFSFFFFFFLVLINYGFLDLILGGSVC